VRTALQATAVDAIHLGPIMVDVGDANPGARACKAERGNTRVLRGRSLVVADELNRWPYPWGRKAPDFRPEPIRAESDQKIRERHQSLFSFHAFHAGLSLI